MMKRGTRRALGAFWRRPTTEPAALVRAKSAASTVPPAAPARKADDAEARAAREAFLEQVSVPTFFGTDSAPLPEPETRTAMNVVSTVRHNWTREEISAVYDKPIMELVYEAATVHRMWWDPLEVQQCTLLSIKTGGCTEDCSYCSQSTRNNAKLKPTPQMKVDEVVEMARRARAAGSTRFCMGAGWRELGNKKTAFNNILEMVRRVKAEGLEVCCTLGMLNEEQAVKLKEAGLSAYNHNLDTSREFYPNIITTRTYDDRLQTIENVRKAGISVCSGGILGLGEQASDRIGMLQTLATMREHPESVPINALVPIEGTKLGNNKPPSVWDMVRMIATARIVLPKSMVRLSAGRMAFSEGEQALMFMAGANSIFNGDKLLTTPNPEFDEDMAMFETLGIHGKEAHKAHRESGWYQAS